MTIMVVLAIVYINVTNILYYGAKSAIRLHACLPGIAFTYVSGALANALSNHLFYFSRFWTIDLRFATPASKIRLSYIRQLNLYGSLKHFKE